MNFSELTELLARNSIPTAQWGKGNAKTIENLLGEVNTGECTLVEESGRLIRKLRLARVEVLYYDFGTSISYRLAEVRQVFADGRMRTRVGLPTSLCEKLRYDEPSKQGARRAVREELGIDETRQIVFSRNKVEKDEMISGTKAVSFPGIWTSSQATIYVWNMPRILFKPEGYVERQFDKSSYFVWRPVT